jgi:sec-independent protein translocase protein TatA
MGATEIVFIFVIYLLLFGAKGIPSLAQTMGKAVRQFRDASNDIQREIMNTGKEIKDEITKNEGEKRDPLG